MLLETTFVNDLVREVAAAVEKRDKLIEAGTPISIAALTVYEVGVGLRGEAAAKRERFDWFTGGIEVVPFGLEEARRAHTIQRRLQDEGEQIGKVDVMIAATAAGRAAPTVLTRNVSEFERVEGIDVETY